MTAGEITSRANPRVKDVVKLRQNRLRHDPGRFVIEGRRLVERAKAAGVELIDVYATASADWKGATLVSEGVMDKMSGGNRQVVAVARSWDLKPPAVGDRERWLALVSVEKPGNIGAVLRSASALGFTGVVVVDSAADVFGANGVRNSMGALFTLPVVSLSGNELAAFCAERDAALIAAVSADGLGFQEASLGPPVVIAIGSESEGLPSWLVAAADQLVTIPMADPALDSLNASIAAALLMAESMRSA